MPIQTRVVAMWKNNSGVMPVWLHNAINAGRIINEANQLSWESASCVYEIQQDDWVLLLDDGAIASLSDDICRLLFNIHT